MKFWWSQFFFFLYVALKLEFGAGSYSGLLLLDCYQLDLPYMNKGQLLSHFAEKEKFK